VEQWLDLCDDSFHYAIKSFSPEINRDMTYFQGSRKDLATMVKLLPKHNTDHSPLRRHNYGLYVDVADDGKDRLRVSSFVVYQNLLDGVNSHIDAGESRLFLVGRYIDTLKLEDDQVPPANIIGAIACARKSRLGQSTRLIDRRPDAEPL